MFEALIIAAGLFSIAGGLFNWDWFINSRKARFFVAILGRDGTRVFYVILGLAIVGVGCAGLLGFIDLSNRGEY